ncbi:MAG: D-glycero-alpha-D-manno-heptose-1,7-bisphosphate 7-phosphatase [Blastocatellia bacterium]
MPETVFLDRDGVINRRLPGDYVAFWAQFAFLPRVPEALRLLTEAGKRLIIITNQRGIALGSMTEANLHAVHTRMCAELESAGVVIQAIYHCPHDHGQCDCRKPLPGLLLRARQDFPAIDFASAVMIGDSVSDMQAGRAAGCRTFFIRHAQDETVVPGGLITDGTAASLYEATLSYLTN